ncbi:MAG: hypothetical protein ISR91_04575 [Candidatus Delongbacteria bacterium]|nr:hypothetical protein [Candidatus Delongbacteria bacterium]
MKTRLLLYTVTALVAVSAVGWALEPAGKSYPQADDQSILTTIDANQLDCFVTNVGVFAYDKSASRGVNDGLYFPNNYPITDTHVIYDAGLWVGAKVNGNVRVTVAEYSQEYVPGIIAPNGVLIDGPEHRVYKIYNGQTSDEDYLNWPTDQGAPMNAAGDGPWIEDIQADQMTFCVFNDGDPVQHGNNAGGTSPLDIEVQLTTFAFDRADPLGNVIFLKYRFINKGVNLLDSTYVSVWSDPDLGGAGDDLVGCDPGLGLGYCYNATNNDSQYGSSPPATGFDFFLGPPDNMDVDGDGDVTETLPMTSFNKYINGTDPSTALESYNYMTGLNADGSVIIDPVTGLETRYQVPGDPVAGSGWQDSDPADRRFMLSAGPFQMAPGDTAEVVSVVMVAQGTDRLSSITYLKYVDGFAQTAFENDFIVSQAPAQPIAHASAFDERIVLVWGDESELTPGDYPFQGYNIFQGESVAGPWHRIATYDLNDGVATIFDDIFDIETGQVVRYPVQFGNDGGLTYSLNLTQDNLTWNGNTGLVNGHPYYYAVTAYSYDPALVPNNLETSKSSITVIPNAGVPGIDYDTVMAPNEATWMGPDTIRAPEPAHVYVDVVDEAAVVAADYEVTFADLNDSTQVWHLDNTTSGVRVLADQLNQVDDDDYLIAEGLKVRVLNGIEGLYGWDWISEGDRWFSGVDWGGAFFFGGLDLGAYFFGSELDPSNFVYPTVEVRFTSNTAEWSNCQTYRRDLGYVVGGVGLFPGSAWDVTDAENPRRLNMCFNEHDLLDIDEDGNPDYTADLLWELLDNTVGGRQYLFIMNSDYVDDPSTLYRNGDWDGDGTIDPNMDTDGNGSNTDPWDGEDELGWGPAADVIYAYWPKLRGDLTHLEADGTWLLQTGIAHRSGVDVYQFSTIGSSFATSEEMLEDIRVVPNPYYGHSSYETKSDVSVVKFRNLPDACTIKVFNLAGDRVRELEKTAADPFNELSWDLLTDNGLPVASGIYVYYVDAPGYGTTFGKMAVIMEVQRLKEL